MMLKIKEQVERLGLHKRLGLRKRLEEEIAS